MPMLESYGESLQNQKASLLRHNKKGLSTSSYISTTMHISVHLSENINMKNRITIILCRINTDQ